MVEHDALNRRLYLSVLAAGVLQGSLPDAQAASTVTWPPITAYPSGAWSPGRWVWVDLITDDINASAKFYEAALGWRFEATEAMGGQYLLARAGQEHVAALVPKRDGTSTGRGHRWLPLMSVPDPDEAAAVASRTGGKVWVPPLDLPGRGRVAVLGDPEDIPFGVIRAQGGDPDDYLAEVGEWVWLELWAHDPERAANFYAPLGGCEIDEEKDALGQAYLQLTSAEAGRASIRATKFPQMPPVWIPFVRVADVAATGQRILAAGGRWVVPPSPERLGGRVGICVDPGLAPFGILALPQEAA